MSAKAGQYSGILNPMSDNGNFPCFKMVPRNQEGRVIDAVLSTFSMFPRGIIHYCAPMGSMIIAQLTNPMKNQNYKRCPANKNNTTGGGEHYISMVTKTNIIKIRKLAQDLCYPR